MSTTVLIETPFGVWLVRVRDFRPDSVQDAARNYVLRQDERLSSGDLRIL